MKKAGVNTLTWQGGAKTRVSVISEPDRREHYDRLATDFAKGICAGEEAVVQISDIFDIQTAPRIVDAEGRPWNPSAITSGRVWG